VDFENMAIEWKKTDRRIDERERSKKAGGSEEKRKK
jgi:hypothetical protein